MVKKRINIVLIGMPGCGKTSVGKLLADRLSMRFCDMDEYIENCTGKTIKEIFAKGEHCFRQLERVTVAKLSKCKNTVISTGGGVILCSENMCNFKKNGLVLFIDRPIKNIAMDIKLSDRPLLENGIHKLYLLFNERYEFYKKYSDYRIQSKEGIRETVEEIIKFLEEKVYESADN